MRLYNGRYVGTSSLESIQQFIFLSLPTLFLVCFSLFSFHILFLVQSKIVLREREREWGFFEQQWSFLLQNGFSMFVSSCCFLCSLFMMKLWLHHRSLSLGISLFLFSFKVFFVSLFFCLKQNYSVFVCLVFLFSATLWCFLKQHKN